MSGEPKPDEEKEIVKRLENALRRALITPPKKHEPEKQGEAAPKPSKKRNKR